MHLQGSLFMAGITKTWFITAYSSSMYIGICTKPCILLELNELQMAYIWATERLPDSFLFMIILFSRMGSLH